MGKGKRFSSEDGTGKKALIPIVITAVAVFAAAAVVFAVISNQRPTDLTNKETMFKEETTSLIKSGEVIQINDPELGLIEIEAIEGVKKNTYDLNSFSYNDDGYKTYYIDGQVASCVGIDLSEYQGDVDFDALKDSGIDYVMLRIGGRGYSEEGSLYPDDAFKTYYDEAKAAGLGVGAYFFSQAQNAEEGKEEAEYALELLGSLDLDYPVAFDWEVIADDEARTDSVTSEDLTDAAIAFCDTIDKAGYQSVIYTNTALLYYKYDLTRLKDKDFWVADYGELPSIYYHFTMWQYTCSATVDGIDGEVDLNVCFKNY